MTQYPSISLQKSFEKYDWYVLIDDCQVIINHQKLIIPKGFTTDFASVPQVLWGIIPPHGLAAMPSVVHDYICENGLFNRAECDKIFLTLLSETKLSRLQIFLMYRFVRLFGWITYKKGAK